MVYLAWIHGASGVLFFEHEDAPVYAGPSNQHLRSPGSTNLWKECTRLAVEGGELAPALLSDRSAAPKISSVQVTVEGGGLAAAAASSGVHVTALLEQRLGGGVVILIANTNPCPANVTITLSTGSIADGPAPVLFSARNVSVADGVVTDWAPTLGNIDVTKSIDSPRLLGHFLTHIFPGADGRNGHQGDSLTTVGTADYSTAMESGTHSEARPEQHPV